MSMQALEATGGLRRWMVSLAIIAVLLVVTFLAVTAFIPGETYISRLGKAYDALWMNTTREQFTRIMQREPWLYIIPAGGIVFVSGWQLPRRYWGRAIYAYVVFGIGFVGGHVFW